ncbi:hypothetical protein RRF57_003254 [Xylaria bambusicola]|uniref:Nnf1-domain-containing protein n=1 Tax=Xylaria bambusicola TaxID=326684 RepID=A0AAN7UK80_9PEZI
MYLVLIDKVLVGILEGRESHVKTRLESIVKSEADKRVYIATPTSLHSRLFLEFGCIGEPRTLAAPSLLLRLAHLTSQSGRYSDIHTSNRIRSYDERNKRTNAKYRITAHEEGRVKTTTAVMASEPPRSAPGTAESQNDQTAEPQQQTLTQSQSQSQAQEQEQQGQAAPSPESPPLPARHTALTPGPRASRFQTTLDSALSHTLAKISWDNFAACYPHIAAHAPATLRAVQSQMVDRLRALCKKEFDSIQQSRNVVAKLNELESLVSEAERRRREAGEDDGVDPPVPPHMLPPDEVLDAHLAPHLAQQQSQLNAKLQTIQAHNAKLFEDIQRQRSEIESLVSLLEKVLEDVGNANHMMDEVVDDVARETRTIEVEMAES